MSFVKFPYKFNIGKKQYKGKMSTLTGMYAGGSVETITSTKTQNGRTTVETSHNTTINIRTEDGKVKTVVASGKVNIPGSCMITIFYYPKGEYLYPYSVYVHDTEKLYSLGKNEQKNARRFISNWGLGRRLWGR
ncbi:hypothetical protein [Enterovibrio norvegicus]|nr:hypothetical protein [Enterovibrio norvegicus]TKF28719.1 hypothetical protein FCV83_22820 [Enterovibrio norvegicus]